MTAEKDALVAEARAYVEDCLAAGVHPDRIETPLGLLAALRTEFGPYAELHRVVGYDWLSSVVRGGAVRGGTDGGPS